jgi:hypothetical protein
MPTAPGVAVISFEGDDLRTTRALDFSTVLSLSTYHQGELNEREEYFALDQDCRWLVDRLTGMHGVERIWLVSTEPGSFLANRLLIELQSGFSWEHLENTVLRYLADHFGWPLADLKNHRKYETSADVPFQLAPQE